MAARPPPTEVNLDADGMHWFVGPHPDPGPPKVRLALRHPGHGWITAPLSLDGAERLERQLHRTRLAQSAPPAPRPASPAHPA